MRERTVLIMIDPLVPAAARARLRQAAADAAPTSWVVSADTLEEALHHAPAARVVAGLRVFAPVVDRAPGLRWIHAFGAGVDRLVDLPRVRDGRITVTRTVDAFSAMPEHVLALALALSRRLDVAVRNQLARRWDRTGAIGWELEGRVMGILGLGHIGRRLAARAASLGMRVIGVKRTLEPVAHVERVLAADGIDELLREADVVVALLPLTPATRGLMGEREFRLMKPDALFINVARGALVQEAALGAALRNGWIAGAGLDVLDEEPPPSDHPLYALDRVIITPHVAAASPRVFDQMATAFAENLRRDAAGEPLLNVVDAARGY